MKLTFFVVLPGFEPGQTEPKPVVLPLHHRTILMCSLLKSGAKVRYSVENDKRFCHFLATSRCKMLKVKVVQG